jgi:hypothetical protein
MSSTITHLESGLVASPSLLQKPAQTDVMSNTGIK